MGEIKDSKDSNRDGDEPVDPQPVEPIDPKQEIFSREHLKGFPSIVSTLIRHGKATYPPDEVAIQNFRETFKNELDAVEKIMKNGVNPDNDSILSDRGRIHMISEVDEKDKFSHNYCNCIGAIIVGRSKKTGKEISFMTHQDSAYADFQETWHKKETEIFDEKFKRKIEELVANCEEGSIDAVLFGGADYDTNYQKVIKKMSQKIRKKLGFEPIVLTGPGGEYSREDGNKTIPPSTSVYFDTQTRKVYLVRQKISDSNRDKPFYASKVVGNN